MSVDVVVSVGFVGLVVLILLYTQVVRPLRARRSVRRELSACGWQVLDAKDETTLGPFQLLALGPAGAKQDTSYTEKIGPFSMDVRSEEQRSCRILEAHRDPNSAYPRVVMIAVSRLRTRRRSRSVVGRDVEHHSMTGRQLWIGELRSLPVRRPETVYDAKRELLGEMTAAMAKARSVDLAHVLGEPTAGGTVADALGPVVKRWKDELAGAYATIHVAPDAWLLVAPLARSAPSFRRLLELARSVSAALG